MIDASSAIELEEFELVEAAPGTALLRIAARSSHPPSGQPPRLVVDDGRAGHRVGPLPAPPDPAGRLRIAYSVSSELLSNARFWLEFADGSALALPEPRRRRRLARQSPTPRRPGDEAAWRAEARRTAIAELERRIRSERARRQEAEAQVQRASSERAAALARVAELEAQQIQERQVQERLQAQIEREAQSLAELDRVLADRESRAARQELTLEHLRQRLDDVEAELAEARARAAAEIEQLRATAGGSRGRARRRAHRPGA